MLRPGIPLRRRDVKDVAGTPSCKILPSKDSRATKERDERPTPRAPLRLGNFRTWFGPLWYVRSLQELGR
jgi:hypothetical protein